MVCGLLFSLNLFKVYDIIKLYLCWLIYTIPQLCEFWYYLQPKKILFQIFCNTILRKALNEKIIYVVLTSFFLFEPFLHDIMFDFPMILCNFPGLINQICFLGFIHIQYIYYKVFSFLRFLKLSKLLSKYS
jgi:hypothetical protein